MDRKAEVERPGTRNDYTIGNTSESGNAPHPDEVLSAVADERRRAVLRLLDDADETVMKVSTLVDQVSACLRNEGQSDGEHRRRVRTALHHTHLPKLEASDLIVYDVETDRIKTVSGGLCRELLATVEPYE